MDSRFFRVLHEYEIADEHHQHFASLLYLRENSSRYTNSNYSDTVDVLMEKCISDKCVVVTKKTPRLIALDKEVEELNKRLRDEYQLKAYFSFYSVDGSKGLISVNGRITIHTTILVKDQESISAFDNIGNQIEAAYSDIVTFTFNHHLPSPVYTLQEHPLVHGIVCCKDAKNPETIYFLYRHNNNSQESVFATVDLPNNRVTFLQGNNPQQSIELQSLEKGFHSQNDYAPLYQYSVIQKGCITSVRLVLNRERDVFERAKKLLLQELDNEKGNNPSFANMISYLGKMYEA